MKRLNTLSAITGALTILALGSRPAPADLIPCVVVSVGAETDAATGSLQNVGQVVIGRTAGGGVHLHAGGLACLAMSSSSLADCGDFDNDGDVDGADFAVFAQCFGGANNPPALTCPVGVDADFDNDDDVDLGDFALLSQCFTG